jgi:hypothetical protein
MILRLHAFVPGTPAIFHPWKIATRSHRALGILPSRDAETPRNERIQSQNHASVTFFEMDLER